MEKAIRILGISGSLRKQSYNSGLLRIANEMVLPGAFMEIFDLAEIPLYNQDLESKMPESVLALKAKVRTSDAILFATPEYNYSIPGVLKNALDWGSRPSKESCWDNKPVAIIGASTGSFGTCRAQYHLRQVFVTLNMHPLNRPELMVGTAQDKFDLDGNLIDMKIKQKIKELLEALIAHSRVLCY